MSAKKRKRTSDDAKADAKAEPDEDADLVDFMNNSGRCPRPLRRLIATYAWSTLDVFLFAVHPLMDRDDDQLMDRHQHKCQQLQVEDKRSAAMLKIKAPDTVPPFATVLSMIADAAKQNRSTINSIHVRNVCQILLSIESITLLDQVKLPITLLFRPWNQRLKEMDPDGCTRRYWWSDHAKFYLRFLYSELLKNTPINTSSFHRQLIKRINTSSFHRQLIKRT
jgi:hypothetical protein